MRLPHLLPPPHWHKAFPAMMTDIAQLPDGLFMSILEMIVAEWEGEAEQDWPGLATTLRNISLVSRDWHTKAMETCLLWRNLPRLDVGGRSRWSCWKVYLHRTGGVPLHVCANGILQMTDMLRVIKLAGKIHQVVKIDLECLMDGGQWTPTRLTEYACASLTDFSLTIKGRSDTTNFMPFFHVHTWMRSLTINDYGHLDSLTPWPKMALYLPRLRKLKIMADHSKGMENILRFMFAPRLEHIIVYLTIDRPYDDERMDWTAIPGLCTALYSVRIKGAMFLDEIVHLLRQIPMVEVVELCPCPLDISVLDQWIDILHQVDPWTTSLVAPNARTLRFGKNFDCSLPSWRMFVESTIITRRGRPLEELAVSATLMSKISNVERKRIRKAIRFVEWEELA